MKYSLSLIVFFNLIFMVGCNDPRSLYIKNSTKGDLEIVYDDRVYRSQIGTTRTLSKITLKADSIFFVGADTSTLNIWPDFLQINSLHDTIVLNGKRSIKSMINEKGDAKLFITIH